MTSVRAVVVGQRIRWNPTSGQKDLVRRSFDQVRRVYNQALAQMQAAYEAQQKLTLNEISRLWTIFKAQNAQHRDISSAVAGQTLRLLAFPANIMILNPFFIITEIVITMHQLVAIFRAILWVLLLACILTSVIIQWRMSIHPDYGVSAF